MSDDAQLGRIEGPLREPVKTRIVEVHTKEGWSVKPEIYNATTLPMSEWRELTDESVQEAVKKIITDERQRCIELIRQQARVYLPGYILDKLIADIEKGE